jgi:hypothetical protein
MINILYTDIHSILGIDLGYTLDDPSNTLDDLSRSQDQRSHYREVITRVLYHIGELCLRVTH